MKHIKYKTFHMKTKFSNSLMFLAVVPAGTSAVGSNGTLSYLIGGIMAFLILGYLIYTLLHPEKF
jgi:K+-transporting ATPase KdpF subunit